MSKSTVSFIRVKEVNKQAYSVFINALEVQFIVRQDKQPQRYERIKQWLENDEPPEKLIVF